MRAARPAAWLLLAALVSCAGPETGPDPAQLAERGIGGTGGTGSGVPQPLPAPAGGSALPRLPADRGIGGTGIASTGVVGMITGFGSIFVDGLEVGLEDAPSITMDGATVPVGALRVGQVAVLSAGPVFDGRSSTQAVAIRHEVVGRVAGMDKAGLLSVAGQQVRLSSATLGDPTPQVGDWIAVSGFREAGEIAATRVDPAADGQVIVHGTMQRDQGGQPGWRIGALPVETMPGMPAAGGSVSVSGREAGGVLRAETLAPDLLVADPAAFFGSGVRYFLIESYARSLGGVGIELAHGPHLSGSLSTFAPDRSGRSVIGFEREPDGSLVATSLHHAARIEPPHASLHALRAHGWHVRAR